MVVDNNCYPDQGQWVNKVKDLKFAILRLRIISSTLIFKLCRFVKGPSMKYNYPGQGQGVKAQSNTQICHLFL